MAVCQAMLSLLSDLHGVPPTCHQRTGSAPGPGAHSTWRLQLPRGWLLAEPAAAGQTQPGPVWPGRPSLLPPAVASTPPLPLACPASLPSEPGVLHFTQIFACMKQHSGAAYIRDYWRRMLKKTLFTLVQKQMPLNGQSLTWTPPSNVPFEDCHPCSVAYETDELDDRGQHPLAHCDQGLSAPYEVSI